MSHPPDRNHRGHSGGERYVILSGYHDYRSDRKANLHFIADQLRQRGETSFVSLRYSRLTRFRDDPRNGLERRANRLETVNGVRCYLWRTPVHAFGLPPRFGWLEHMVFDAVARHLPAAIRAEIAGATTILVESGIGLIYLPLIKRLNGTATVVYMASDSLDAINQADAIKAAFRRHARLIDRARLPSPLLRADVPAAVPCHYIPHGIEKQRFAAIGPSPYGPDTRNAVSVGSMLFDPGFFAIAGPLFPDVTFHVIGSGYSGPSTANVVYHPEMPFKATLPYLKHADFAIAPYRMGVEPYLTHTSMKLMQYSFLQVPAVCPATLVSGTGVRFGYETGNATSIGNAIRRALQAGPAPAFSHLDWSEVADQLLDPPAESVVPHLRPAAARDQRRPSTADLRPFQHHLSQ